MNYHQADHLAPATTDIPDAAVGGGYFIARRNSVGRIRMPRCPYEHPSLEAATAEAVRMSKLNRGRTYMACYVVSEHLSLDNDE